VKGVTAFQHAHASLAPLDARELAFLLDVGAIRLERLREFEDDDRDDGEEAKPELSLVA
jgi:hypothetical protein